MNIRKVLGRAKFAVENWRWQRQQLKQLDPIKAYYDSQWKHVALDAHLVLYEMRDGQQFGDSPRELLRVWLENSPQMRHVVVYDPAFKTAVETSLKVADLQNKVTLVDKTTPAYADALLQAHYVVTNAMIFSDIFVKRPGQIFINTWHGTPLKKMGYAMPGGVMGSWNVIRNFLQTDYLLAPNALTARIYREDYRLDGLYTGEILTLGYPRNDVFFKDAPALPLARDERPMLLYAPTWTGTVTGEVQPEALAQTLATVKALQAAIPAYQVKIKLHPYIAKYAQHLPEWQQFLIDDALDANDVMTHTAVLLTDYSSLFFDFLLTGRPIIFFDTTVNYASERGYYMPTDQLPGPHVTTVEQVAHLLAHDVQSIYRRRYAEFQAQFVQDDDGKAAQRLWEVLQAPVTPTRTTALKIVVNAGTFTNQTMTQVQIKQLQKWGQNFDVTLFAQQQLLKSWYGHQFFGHIDALAPTSRVMINPTHTGNNPHKTERRYLAQQAFDVLIDWQKWNWHTRVSLFAHAKVVVIRQDVRKKSELLANRGYATIGERDGWAVFARPKNAQVATEILQQLGQMNL